MELTVDFVILACLVLTESQSVTDRRTDASAISRIGQGICIACCYADAPQKCQIK